MKAPQNQIAKCVVIVATMTSLLIIGVVIWIFQRPDAINRENYARIEFGMTENQVNEILGGSANGLVYHGSDGTSGMTWTGSLGKEIFVELDLARNQGVRRKEFRNPGLWEWISAPSERSTFTTVGNKIDNN